MSAEVLNTFINYPGSWNPSFPTTISNEVVRTISPARAVRLHSTAVSGGVALVNLSSGGQPITLSGGPEVYVKILFSNNTFTYLSAPLSSAVDYADVSELTVGISAIIANPACTDVSYQATINAHLIYELL
jgi:hypothetical protein